MIFTIELSSEESMRLQKNAAFLGVKPEDLIKKLISKSDFKNEKLPKTGADLLKAINDQNLSGDFGEPSLSSLELAQTFRRQAESREI